MFFKSMCSLFVLRFSFFPKTALFFLAFLSTFSLPKLVQALPCYPTDPAGLNPGNLCLQYPNPSINPNSFMQGEARPIRALPDITVPAGRVLIQPRGSYWTEIRTQVGGRQIQTSGGDRYNVLK